MRARRVDGRVTRGLLATASSLLPLAALPAQAETINIARQFGVASTATP